MEVSNVNIDPARLRPIAHFLEDELLVEIGQNNVLRFITRWSLWVILHSELAWCHIFEMGHHRNISLGAVIVEETFHFIVNAGGSSMAGTKAKQEFGRRRRAHSWQIIVRPNIVSPCLLAWLRNVPYCQGCHQDEDGEPDHRTITMAMDSRGGRGCRFILRNCLIFHGCTSDSSALPDCVVVWYP